MRNGAALSRAQRSETNTNNNNNTDTDTDNNNNTDNNNDNDNTDIVDNDCSWQRCSSGGGGSADECVVGRHDFRRTHRVRARAARREQYRRTQSEASDCLYLSLSLSLSCVFIVKLIHSLSQRCRERSYLDAARSTGARPCAAVERLNDSIIIIIIIIVVFVERRRVVFSRLSTEQSICGAERERERD